MRVRSQGELWGIAWVGKDVHAVPLGDILTHKKSRHCHCGPRFETRHNDPTWVGDSSGVVVIHNAYDGRPEE